MQTEHRRAPCHLLLGGAVEVTDLESEKQIATSARNLSLFGYFVATATPFVTGTKVRVRITHQGATFAAFGSVAYTSTSEGMGIAFGKVEPRDRVLCGNTNRARKGGQRPQFCFPSPLQHWAGTSEVPTVV
jgi:hypothetical protein